MDNDRQGSEPGRGFSQDHLSGEPQISPERIRPEGEGRECGALPRADREADESLRASERRLRAFVEHTPAAVAMLDRDLRYLIVSRRYLTDYGLPDPDILGRHHYEVFPEMPERWREIHRRCLAGAVERCDEDRFPRADGRLDWVRWEVRPWLGPAGEVGGLMLFSEVITARKLVEDRLRLQTSALQAAANGVVITDARGRIEWVNDAFVRLTGYSREEAIGNSTRILRSGRHDDTFYRELWQTVEAGGVWRGELVNRRKDGTLYDEEMTITPVRSEAGAVTHFIAVKQDVTARRRTEAQLLQAQKLEALGQLAGGIAHDFNNALTGVIGNCDIALMELATGADAAPSLAEIRAAGMRAASIARQLLVFSRRQELTLTRLDLNAVADGLAKMLRRLIGEHVELETSLSPGLAPIRGDVGQLEQVITNMCLNARDAMPPGGGRIRIATRNLAPTEAETLGVPPNGAAAPGATSYVALTIRDNGSGMPPEVVARLFEPFFTTKPRGKGTGLGLALAHGIVSKHGGAISVDSAPGLGTTFTIVLPATDAAAPAPREDSASLAPPRGEETVLVVDDEESVRAVTSRALDLLGYRVLVASSGYEAIGISSHHRDRIHLVLSDVGMPGLSGPEAIAEIARARPGLKVLFMSGHVPERLAIESLGRHACLPKPFSTDALARRVRAILDEPATGAER